MLLRDQFSLARKSRKLMFAIARRLLSPIECCCCSIARKVPRDFSIPPASRAGECTRVFTRIQGQQPLRFSESPAGLYELSSNWQDSIAIKRKLDLRMSLHTLHIVQGLSHQRERLFGKSDFSLRRHIGRKSFWKGESERYVGSRLRRGRSN